MASPQVRFPMTPLVAVRPKATEFVMQQSKRSWPLPIKLSVRYGSIYALICGCLFAFQRSVLYHPSHEPPSGTLEPWTHDGETIGFCREVIEPETVWLMMHGNAGQACDRDYVLEHLSPSDSLYVLEYPGYGAREGKPGRPSFDQAAREAYELLSAKYPDTPLGVIGESIGSGPACSLANATRLPSKIVLVVPFDSLYRVASRRFFFLPVWLLLLDRWDNMQALHNYHGPVDIYGATFDEIIPIHHARNLANHCSRANMIEIPCSHNEWSYETKVRISR